MLPNHVERYCNKPILSHTPSAKTKQAKYTYEPVTFSNCQKHIYIYNSITLDI
jgi:hypothetical protein